MQIRWRRVALDLILRIAALAVVLRFVITTRNYDFAFWFALLLAFMLAAQVGFRLCIWCAVLRKNR